MGTFKHSDTFFIDTHAVGINIRNNFNTFF